MKKAIFLILLLLMTQIVIAEDKMSVRQSLVESAKRLSQFKVNLFEHTQPGDEEPTPPASDHAKVRSFCARECQRKNDWRPKCESDCMWRIRDEAKDKPHDSTPGRLTCPHCIGKPKACWIECMNGVQEVTNYADCINQCEKIPVEQKDKQEECFRSCTRFNPDGPTDPSPVKPEDCPPDKPWLHPTKNECVACPAHKPKFNGKECDYCPDGTSWSSIQNDCIKQEDPAPVGPENMCKKDSDCIPHDSCCGSWSCIKRDAPAMTCKKICSDEENKKASETMPTCHCKDGVCAVESVGGEEEEEEEKPPLNVNENQKMWCTNYCEGKQGGSSDKPGWQKNGYSSSKICLEDCHARADYYNLHKDCFSFTKGCDDKFDVVDETYSKTQGYPDDFPPKASCGVSHCCNALTQKSTDFKGANGISFKAKEKLEVYIIGKCPESGEVSGKKCVEFDPKSKSAKAQTKCKDNKIKVGSKCFDPSNLPKTSCTTPHCAGVDCKKPKKDSECYEICLNECGTRLSLSAGDMPPPSDAIKSCALSCVEEAYSNCKQQKASCDSMALEKLQDVRDVCKNSKPDMQETVPKKGDSGVILNNPMGSHPAELKDCIENYWLKKDSPSTPEFNDEQFKKDLQSLLNKLNDDVLDASDKSRLNELASLETNSFHLNQLQQNMLNNANTDDLPRVRENIEEMKHYLKQGDQMRMYFAIESVLKNSDAASTKLTKNLELFKKALANNDDPTYSEYGQMEEFALENMQYKVVGGSRQKITDQAELAKRKKLVDDVLAKITSMMPLHSAPTSAVTVTPDTSPDVEPPVNPEPPVNSEPPVNPEAQDPKNWCMHHIPSHVPIDFIDPTKVHDFAEQYGERAFRPDQLAKFDSDRINSMMHALGGPEKLTTSYYNPAAFNSARKQYLNDKPNLYTQTQERVAEHLTNVYNRALANTPFGAALAPQASQLFAPPKCFVPSNLVNGKATNNGCRVKAPSKENTASHVEGTQNSGWQYSSWMDSFTSGFSQGFFGGLGNQVKASFGLPGVLLGASGASSMLGNGIMSMMFPQAAPYVGMLKGLSSFIAPKQNQQATVQNTGSGNWMTSLLGGGSLLNLFTQPGGGASIMSLLPMLGNVGKMLGLTGGVVTEVSPYPTLLVGLAEGTLLADLQTLTAVRYPRESTADVAPVIDAVSGIDRISDNPVEVPRENPLVGLDPIKVRYFQGEPTRPQDEAVHIGKDGNNVLIYPNAQARIDISAGKGKQYLVLENDIVRGSSAVVYRNNLGAKTELNYIIHGRPGYKYIVNGGSVLNQENKLIQSSFAVPRPTDLQSDVLAAYN